MNNHSSTRHKNILPFVTIPALLCGVFTMICSDVPAKIQGINLAAGFLFMIVVFLYSRKVFQFKKANPYLVISIGVAAILLTFLSDGIMGVHRWVNFGPLQLNMGLIVSPLILIQISRLKNQTLSYLLFIFITPLFVLQPDASLVTAFSIASMFIFFRNSKNRTILSGLSVFTVLAVAYTWLHLDQLPPVSYVERIIHLSWQISPGLTILSVVSLLLLIYPFVVNGHQAIPLGVYFFLLIISSFIGNFPVMIMGYGVAPIIGYAIAQVWLVTSTNKDITS